MMADNTLGAAFSIDITDLKAGLTQANRLIRESESQFREAAAGMDDWTESEEGLTARVDTLNDQIGIQEKKVSALVAEKQRIIEIMTAEGKSNEEIERSIDGVNKQITKESAQLDKLKGELSKSEDALESFKDGTEDAGDEAEETGGKLEGLKGAAGVAGKAIAAIAGAAASAVGAFLALGESTREARENMARLETSFASAGLSAQAAEDTMTGLYGLLGDEGRATEAAQQLAKISDNEKDLEANTRILTGVMGEYGESIPTEGLAEGMAA